MNSIVSTLHINVGSEELKPTPHWVWICLTLKQVFCQSRNSGATLSPLVCHVLGRGLCTTAVLPWGLGGIKISFWFQAGFNIWPKSDLKQGNGCTSSRVLGHGQPSGCQKHIKLLITPTKSVEYMIWALEGNRGWRYRFGSPPYRWWSLKDTTLYQKFWKQSVISFIVTEEMRSALR